MVVDRIKDEVMRTDLKFSSIDATGVFENTMFSADQQVISDHIYANATLMSFLDPEMSRCVMWKEILKIEKLSSESAKGDQVY